MAARWSSERGPFLVFAATPAPIVVSAIGSVARGLLLDEPAALEGPAEGDLVGVLEVSADR